MNREAEIAALVLPAAARMQSDVARDDYRLTAAARERHPAVRWWWGQRVIAGTNGAYCYLCDRLVATWARIWPLTEAARVIVLDHRDAHLAGALSHPGIDTAGMSPAGEAPPAGGQE